MSTNSPGVEFGLQLIDFLIPLLVIYLRYSQGKCGRLSRHLPKEIQGFVSFLATRLLRYCRGKSYCKRIANDVIAKYLNAA